MSWTKRQLVEQAFEEIGFASYVFDLDTDRLQSALRRLDAMMAAWNIKNIRVGYPLPESPADSSLDDVVNVPDLFTEAIYTNLAIKLCSSVGKVASAELKANAHMAYKNALLATVSRSEMQYEDTLPLGAGNKPWRYGDPFVSEPADSLIADGDQSTDLLEY